MSFEAAAANELGMKQYVVVDGTAEIEEGGAPGLLSKLAQRYVGVGTEFPPMDDPPPGYVTRITPMRVRGLGPWTD